MANFRKKREVRRQAAGERTFLQKTSLRLMEVIHFRTNCSTSGARARAQSQVQDQGSILLPRSHNLITLPKIYILGLGLGLGLTFDFRHSVVCFLFFSLFLWLFCTYYRLRYQSERGLVGGSCQPIDQNSGFNKSCGSWFAFGQVAKA